jgi:alpha-mannosidase
MNIKRIFILMLCLTLTGAYAQTPAGSGKAIINGFGQKISGNDFTYHSSISLARECLLVRANDGSSSMEWETDPVHFGTGDRTVTIVWLAGLGSSPGKAGFDLAVNGTRKFTFHTDGSEEWQLDSDDGASLAFKSEMSDRSDDRFGFMYLTIPTSQLKAGEPLTLKVTGNNSGKTSWYMTFKFPLKSGLNIKSLPAITEVNGKDYQLAVAGILHFGQPVNAKIFINRNLVKETEVGFGYNTVNLELPRVTKNTVVNYRLEVDGNVFSGKLELQPVRNWRVNFVQHSHTDIGYTRSQTEILGEHMRFIDYALDYCDITDNYPDEAKFRWTCEASWAVDEYIRSRPPAQVDRLMERVADGRIEITGMYFNFDELPDEQTLAASLHPLSRFREIGLEVKTAMQNDVNGIGWALNDYYSDMGVKYLNMGTHGHRALICFDKPTLFWWESPSGKRMLAYRAEHYMTGNAFQIHTGNFNEFENELLTYLHNLEGKGYAYDLISIQHSGYFTDNSPPSLQASDMIRQWNEKYKWPKLKTASATEFFEEMETRYAGNFEVIRGAWPDWWTDGFGASAREVAAVRMAQSDLIANSAGLTMAALQGSGMPAKISDRIDAANSALLFYTEHTVGYHSSVREPFHKYTKEQRALKESYAWEAARRSKMLGEETLGLLQAYTPREEDPSLVVYNTLSWTRSGYFTVYIDHQLIPRNSFFTIVDRNGNKAKAQPVEHHSDGTYWAVWVDDIPAFGFKKFVIKADKSKTSPVAVISDAGKYEMENDWYKMTIDKKLGTISGLYDKELQEELVDNGSEWKFGEFIYEMLGNRSQMESFTLNDYTRERPDSIWFDGYMEGEVWNTVRFRGNTRAATRDGALEVEIRLFNTVKRIDLAYEIEKKMVTDPEGIYIAFPLRLDGGQLAFDVQGGEVRAGVDQIPGSTNDWNTVQNYARLANSKGQILLSSPQIPLMQFGGINTGRYIAGATPASSHIYGWPMNNYWTTNFNAEQHGGIHWVYTVSSSADPSPQEANRFGWANRTPFLARVLPGGGKGDSNWSGSYITGWPDNVLLISAMPAEDGRSAILHVREIAGETGNLVLRSGVTGEVLTGTQVDVTGFPVQNGSAAIKPFESKFFRIQY